MAKFFLGQRVRVVGAYSQAGQNVIGVEGIVNEIGCESWDPRSYIGVTLPVEEPFNNRKDCWAFSPDQLEPILDQHQPCDAEFKADLDRLLEREGERA